MTYSIVSIHKFSWICSLPASVCLSWCLLGCPQGWGSSRDLYLLHNGRLAAPERPLQPGAVYQLQPRLCGGKGGESQRRPRERSSSVVSPRLLSGFGSMLRALGAQIEKTTNREACRDLSGRRLRDVNHEKE